jgi:hypothetical protein
VELHCVLRPYQGEEAFERARERIWAELERRSLLRLLGVVQEVLGSESYSLHHVLPSGREAISRAIFAELKERYAIQYEAMYQESRAAIAQFHEAGLPLPEELRMAAQLALAHRFDEAIAEAPEQHFDPTAYARALEIAEEAARYGSMLRLGEARRHFEAQLSRLMRRVCAGETDPVHGGNPARSALSLLEIAEQLGLSLDLDPPQERLYQALRAGLTRNESVTRLALELGLSERLLR